MKVLDLFCGAGGAAMGLHRAGLKVVGVDIVEQPEYPFEFIQSDVFELPKEFFEEFDLIWASPPCQAFSWGTIRFRIEGKEYPDLIDKTRDLLRRFWKPFIIENVPPAPIRIDLLLCGEMFDLALIRHRIFEIEKFIVSQPLHRLHKNKLYDGSAVGVWTGGYHPGYWGNKKLQEKISKLFRDLNGKDILQKWQEAMEIDWITNKKMLAEAIPPAYSEFIGKEFKLYCEGKGQRTLF